MSLFKKKHKHKWRATGHAVLKDETGKEHLRLVLICDKCFESIHMPIYTLKQLTEKNKNESL